MEELKSLAAVLKDLPHTAVWAIIAFLVYKLSVLASIYATIRYVVAKAAEGYITKISAPKLVNIGSGLTISEDTQAQLQVQLARLPAKGNNYVHSTDVALLKAALDEALAKRKV